MSDTDQAHEAVERLESRSIAGSRSAGLRPALIPAPHRADRRGGRRGEQPAGRLRFQRLEQQRREHHLRHEPELQIHVRQPRHDQPVLRPDPVRDPRTRANCSAAPTAGRARNRSNVSQMVNAVNSAVSAGVDGIAVSLVDLTAFNAPVENALKAGIPVVAYNADAPSPQQAPGVHRPEPGIVGRKDGRTHREPRALGRHRAVHRDPGPAQHPDADQRRAQDAQKTPGDHDARDRHRRRACPRSSR